MLKSIRYAFFVIWWAVAATAQSPVWVQVEAQPTLTAAQDRVRAYAAALDNVAGFYLGSGWYGIVLGPYAPDDADALLRSLRGQRLIPADSFIAFGNNFQQQFWPVGVGAETTAQPLPGATEVTDPVVAEPLPEPTPIAIPDETPRQARASEALMTRPEKELLQVALKWAGHYQGAIDGSYGRGTRGAMESWQIANNQEATGILTTAQRAELIGAYNAVLDGMNLQLVRDDVAGIEIALPTGVVAFAEYEPPFARYDAKGDIPAQVLLISQPGDQNRMFGLYEILQTLEVVPTEGERVRRNREFEINAQGRDLVSYTYVNLRNDRIKGYMLVWPAGDDERFGRIRDEMKASFDRINGVLDPAIAAPDEDQATDLVAGLQVRKPRLSRSGFFIDGTGSVLTTTEAIDSCERLTIDTDTDAEVAHRDDALGLAVLRPTTRLAPIAVAAFQTGVPRLQSEVAVAGYPYGGVLVTPSLTFGRLADLRGLNGEEEVKRLALTAQPGDAGGPVFDNGGAILGMLLPRSSNSGQVLPPEVSFSVDADQIVASLTGAGIAVDTTDTVAFMPPETLTLRAADQTVLVSCW
ncbi:trypsin-like peptidase domain-containing protein [Yoonia sp. R2331]|uniref:trypsin-like peptidase domain-containing protein n=1 Tax=Yoonia sp. R2331 TaxID=3237238 RepID=UPI0034E49885